jgi:hypothetical protein
VIAYVGPENHGRHVYRTGVLFALSEFKSELLLFTCSFITGPKSLSGGAKENNTCYIFKFASQFASVFALIALYVPPTFSRVGGLTTY